MSNLDATGPVPMRGSELGRGKLFGRYILLEGLGEGAAGQVYAGFDPELERKVAIKVLVSAEDDDQAWAQTVREARAVAKLAHPNVVVVHETGLEEGVPYIVTELVDGNDLAAWLAARPDASFDALLEVFVAAGEGLAAAHAAGIVHGDFKPANVLVGGDGRPRVADFGVARLIGAQTTGDPWEADTTGELAASKTAAMVGTPHYMAPEQFEGSAASEASDQYAFCQAFAEALAGVRLFDAKTLEALAVAKIQPAPLRSLERPVPAGLWRVLERGLEVEPNARHPSMVALLDAIASARRRHRTRWLGFGAAVLALGGAATGYTALGADPGTQPCTGAERHLASVWSPKRAATIGEAMETGHGALASELWPRASALLDRYASDWVSGHVDACTASAYREQSDATLEARMMCLGDRKDAFETLVDALETASTSAVVGAVTAAASLPDLDTCADPDAIASAFAPVDAADAAAVSELRTVVRWIEARRAIADFEGALALIDTHVPQAEALEHASTEAQLRYQRARIFNTQGKPDASSEEAGLSARLALAGSDDPTAIAALMLQTQVLADSNRPPEADAALAWLDALVQRDDTPRSRAAFAGVEGWTRFTVGDHAAAEELLRKAVRMRRELHGPRDRRVASAERNLGQVLRDAGKSAEAVEVLTHAKATFAEVLSPRHPEVATSLSLLGTAQINAGDMEAGKASIEQALELTLEVFGPDHLSVALIQNNLAAVATMQGELENAERLLENVVRIMSEVYGPEHPRLALMLGNVAAIALERGLPEKALESLARVEAIQTRGKLHPPDLLATLSNKTLALLDLERFEEALAVALQGTTLADEHLSTPHPDAAHAYERLGLTLAQLGRNDDALAAYSRAIEEFGPEPPIPLFTALLRDRAALLLDEKRYDEALEDVTRAEAMLVHQPPSVGLLHTRFVLAQVLWAQGRARARATTIARDAMAEADGLDDPDLAQRIEAWLDSVEGDSTP